MGYDPEYGWTCAWSNGSPRPFLLVGFTSSTRKEAIKRFMTVWDSTVPVMKGWRKAYRDGVRCVRVQISPSFQDKAP